MDYPILVSHYHLYIYQHMYSYIVKHLLSLSYAILTRYTDQSQTLDVAQTVNDAP